MIDSSFNNERQYYSVCMSNMDRPVVMNRQYLRVYTRARHRTSSAATSPSFFFFFFPPPLKQNFSKENQIKAVVLCCAVDRTQLAPDCICRYVLSVEDAETYKYYIDDDIYILYMFISLSIQKRRKKRAVCCKKNKGAAARAVKSTQEEERKKNDKNWKAENRRKKRASLAIGSANPLRSVCDQRETRTVHSCCAIRQLRGLAAYSKRFRHEFGTQRSETALLFSFG